MPKFKFRIILLHRKTILRALAVFGIGVLAIIGIRPSIKAVFKQSGGPEGATTLYSVESNGPEAATSFNRMG